MKERKQGKKKGSGRKGEERKRNSKIEELARIGIKRVREKGIELKRNSMKEMGGIP